MTGLQAVDDEVSEFSLKEVAETYRLSLKNLVVLHFQLISCSLASSLYWEKYEASFNEFQGNCYLSGTHPFIV
jgi:hypothetical protein